MILSSMRVAATISVNKFVFGMDWTYLEEVAARAVEGDPGVVDEVRVDAEARTASAALALHDVRTDCLAMNRVVAKLHRLSGREHSRVQGGERKRRYLALQVLI